MRLSFISLKKGSVAALLSIYMRILVTGGAGFIGSHTTEHLVRAGHDVAVLDDLSTGNAANLEAVAGDIELLEADIRDYQNLERACEGVDAVLHLAAISSVVKSLEEPLTAQAVNATGSLNVLEAARRRGAGRVILASSAAVYGDDPELPKAETSPVQPLSPYAWHKLTGEFYGKAWSRYYGIEFLALRYFNVYGPRQDPASPYSGVLSIFLDRSAKGLPLTIFGDGEQTRDFIHVSDVAEVNRRALEAGGPLPDVINVATGRETRIIDAARVIQENSGSEAGVDFGPGRPGDIRRSCATGELLAATFGYAPAVTVEEGLAGLSG